ncbi:hypothetical protein [Lactobacillus amylovorus]|uniref:hypothetical protein n=1 Tax=Lactobacillus amylovorus TaxID=1604 RepID=UPI000E4EB1E3|nr:hypothetical protein [Lactobacillus amylovorus]RGW84959.1 hypothetical protein DWV49_05395 [Lactobacillus amylovorus]
MKYNLSALEIDSYVKTNLIKMLQLHNITKDIISLKDVDVPKLHDLVDEVIVFNPSLSGKLSSTWQDVYKLLSIQAVMLYKIFFEELDMVAKEQLSLLLQHINYNLTIELPYLVS